MDLSLIKGPYIDTIFDDNIYVHIPSVTNSNLREDGGKGTLDF